MTSKAAMRRTKKFDRGKHGKSLQLIFKSGINILIARSVIPPPTLARRNLKDTKKFSFVEKEEGNSDLSTCCILVFCENQTIFSKYTDTKYHINQRPQYPHRSIILSLAAFSLRLSKSRSRIAAFISSSRVETLAHASSRAACYQQQKKPQLKNTTSFKSQQQKFNMASRS